MACDYLFKNYVNESIFKSILCIHYMCIDGMSFFFNVIMRHSMLQN